MFNWFKKRKKRSGLIAALHIEQFWEALSEQEKILSKELFVKCGHPVDPQTIEGETALTDAVLSASLLLSAVGNKSAQLKHYDLAEKFLAEAANRETDPESKHEVLNALIDVYYKQREEKENAIEKCIEYCLSDIELVSKLQITGSPIDAPSFKRLAIIFEDRQKYQDAIQISELAIYHGLTDGTKGGFQARIQKLQKKMS